MATVYFATARNPLGGEPPIDFGPGFHPVGLGEPPFGWVDVTGEKLDQIKIVTHAGRSGRAVRRLQAHGHSRLRRHRRTQGPQGRPRDLRST